MENTYIVQYVVKETDVNQTYVYFPKNDNSPYQAVLKILSALYGEVNILSLNYIPENYTVSYGTV